jgi:hypothetical protein
MSAETVCREEEQEKEKKADMKRWEKIREEMGEDMKRKRRTNEKKFEKTQLTSAVI